MMIHRDSKESPLYSGGHLTREERLQRLVEQSKYQARYIESQILFKSNSTRSMKPDVARLSVEYKTSRFYVAVVGLGTFPGKRKPYMNYYLIIDTASDRTWLQYENATKTFNLDMPLYPWSSSTMYRPIPCNRHPLCKGDKCNVDGQCTYISSYASGCVTSGIVTEEMFTQGSNTGGLESIKLLMGCGFRQDNFENFIGRNHIFGKPDLIAGILGLGPGEWSFINQLGVAGEGQFAYCFETFNFNIEGSDTYLRFGADATIGGAGQKVHTTPIVVPDYKTWSYYLNLEDISVGNKNVGFPRGTFKLNIRREGGTIIDSGTPISVMYKDHFDRIADLVKAHFKELGVEYIGSQYNFTLCFRPRRRFDITNYPSIIFHFQQADYVITYHKANFMVTLTGNICLGIFPTNTNRPAFILGAMQQTNK
ncbi:aspartic proteinase nepenthesin-2-like [Papaver somniferum]|uniref:aspartic proteinase nepenthesin-2-like n=1 Tax=Papaver somniferum TaxID=3469 RepID=UPI000E6F78CE|nr:aspartic proteinase nepenthesin-2-like [Papaver somniferum]